MTLGCLSLQALNEEIVNRKKNVDQAIRNGQALLKQTTGNMESWACSGPREGSGKAPVLHMVFPGKSVLSSDTLLWGGHSSSGLIPFRILPE